MKKFLEKMRSKIRQNRAKLVVFGLTLVFFIIFLWPSVVVSIRPGELGVLYSRFFGGTVLEKSYDEGIHFIMPWNIMAIYDVRLQEETQTINVLSLDGLTIKVQVSLRFQLIRNRLPYLHQGIGPNYREKIVFPIMNSAVRQTIGSYRPDALYSTARQELQDRMLVDAVEEMGRIPILIQGFVVKSILLPEILRKAIEEKLVAEQNYLKYNYILKEAAQEARRKAIEGIGIKHYQALVNKNMTQKYLAYEGIKATKELAASDNAKIVVIGGKDGLPIILNAESQQPEIKDASPTKQTTDPLTDALKTTKPPEPDAQKPVKGKDDTAEQNDSWMESGETFIDFLKRLDKTLLNPHLPKMPKQ